MLPRTCVLRSHRNNRGSITKSLHKNHNKTQSANLFQAHKIPTQTHGSSDRDRCSIPTCTWHRRAHQQSFGTHFVSPSGEPSSYENIDWGFGLSDKLWDLKCLSMVSHWVAGQTKKPCKLYTTCTEPVRAYWICSTKRWNSKGETCLVRKTKTKTNELELERRKQDQLERRTRNK
jgi:hypothetical protein